MVREHHEHVAAGSRRLDYDFTIYQVLKFLSELWLTRKARNQGTCSTVNGTMTRPEDDELYVSTAPF